MKSLLTKQILLSGIQPSGHLTIGHYAGALANWANMQQDYHCLFMLADLHTITVRQNPADLRDRCYDVLALYIANGIDPEKNIIFAQSHVPAHTQLAWVLSCNTHMGELNRMTQFKDKSQQHASNVNVGLFSYPVLMAADILLYNTHKVPVGEDQKQHLELTRDIALRFNHHYGEILSIPTPYISPQGARLMSLQDPTRKMSKSDSNENSYIALLDSPEIIRNKFKRAVTDSGSEICADINKPGVTNLLMILSLMTGQTIQVLETAYQGVGYGQFKRDVAEAVITKLIPIQEKYRAWREDTVALSKVLAQGAERARQQAQIVLKRVYEAVGLL